MFSENKGIWYIKPVPSPDEENTESPTIVGLLCSEMSGQVMGLIHGAISNLFEENWFSESAESWTKEETAKFFRNQELIAMDICEAVAGCLLDPESPAYEALKNQIAKQIQQGADSDSQEPTYTGNDSGLGKEKDATLTSGECDSDIMFGFATQVVDLLNSSINDVFEIIEVGSNIAEREAILLQNVPMLGETVGILEQILDEIVENYSAYYTEELRTEFRCDIWCMILESDDCTLSFSQLANYFYGKAGGSPTNAAFNVFIETLMEGLVAGASTIYVAHALLCGALQYASEWAGLSVPALQKVVQTYLNDPDSDWITLCEDCASECPQYVFNFETVECWLIDPMFYEGSNATYTPAEGFYGIPNGSGTAIKIYWNIPASSGVSITYHAKSVTDQDCYTGIIYTDGTGDHDHALDNIPAGTRVERSYTIPDAVGITRIAVYCFGGSNGNQYYLIDSATIAYTED